jgi:RNA-binding protein
MPALSLPPAERGRLRAEAQRLDPVVRIGADGATASVRRELDAALKAHGLVKVRVFDDAREVREALFAELADALSAATVQHIGKLLVFWRAPEPKQKTPRDDRGAGPKVVKVLKFSKSGNHRPQVKRVTVTGNMRLTQGGELKRARKRTANSKKKQLA